MKRYTRGLTLGAALAALTLTVPVDAQGPVIKEIRFSVQDMETKEIIGEISANGDLVLEVGDHVRLRTIAVPAGGGKSRRYPSASFELGNPAGLVSMSKMNGELGSTVIQVHRTSNRNRPDAVPFLRFKITEPLKIGSRHLSGNIYLRLRHVEAPAPSTPPTTGPSEPRRGVLLFEHKNYGGRNLKFVEDVRDLADGGYFRQDMATSARVDPGCRITLYQHPDYQGDSTVLTEDISNLSGSRVRNDSVSSLRVDCDENWRQGDNRHDNRHNSRNDDRQDRRHRDRRGVTLFEHPDYRGRSETFYQDDSRLSDNAIRQDTVSSMRVDPGCRAVLYEHPNYDGRASVLSEDVANMRNTRVGDDRVSSLEIRCEDSRRSDRRDGRRGSGGRSDYGDRTSDERRDSRGITLFEHPDYRGHYETFFDDDDRLNDNEIRQDSVSSIRIDSGCEAVLYEHPNFQGRATVVTSDVDNLRGTRVGDNAVSSIEVVCRRGRRY